MKNGTIRRPTETQALAELERLERREVVRVARWVIREGLRRGESEGQILADIRRALDAWGLQGI